MIQFLNLLEDIRIYTGATNLSDFADLTSWLKCEIAEF